MLKNVMPTCIWCSGTESPLPAASSVPKPFQHQPVSPPAWCVSAWSVRRTAPDPWDSGRRGTSRSGTCAGAGGGRSAGADSWTAGRSCPGWRGIPGVVRMVSRGAPSDPWSPCGMGGRRPCWGGGRTTSRVSGAQRDGRLGICACLKSLIVGEGGCLQGMGIGYSEKRNKIFS